MPKFRKKPVVIEAVQLGDDARPALTPSWMSDAWSAGTMFWSGDHWTIRTLEGDHRAVAGDWIIRGIKGELYPCKPDIFDATYDPA